MEGLSQTLDVQNTAWTQKVSPLRLPPHTRLLLADVAVGSDTPSLVGNVLRWRQANPKDADDLWTLLDEENKEFGRTLDGLSAECQKNRALYEQVANYLSSIQQIQVSGIPPDLGPLWTFHAFKFIVVGSKPGVARGATITYRPFREAAHRIRGSQRSALGMRFL